MSETKPKYGIGDKVKIVNFGHLIWENKKNETLSSFPIYKETDPKLNGYRVIDINHEIIGCVGLVCKVNVNQGEYFYDIDGVGSAKIEEQMELISKNQNN